MIFFPNIWGYQSGFLHIFSQSAKIENIVITLFKSKKRRLTRYQSFSWYHLRFLENFLDFISKFFSILSLFFSPPKSFRDTPSPPPHNYFYFFCWPIFPKDLMALLSLPLRLFRCSNKKVSGQNYDTEWNFLNRKKFSKRQRIPFEYFGLTGGANLVVLGFFFLKFTAYSVYDVFNLAKLIYF